MNNKKNSGTSLISLLLIAVIGLTIAGGATMMVIINSQSGLKFQESTLAYALAQSGADNAMLRLLRDPSYIGESNLQMDGGTVDIAVSNINGGFIATTSGRVGNYIRKIQIRARYDENHVLVVDSRKEIF
jgi:hypothetical protein